MNDLRDVACYVSTRAVETIVTFRNHGIFITGNLLRNHNLTFTTSVSFLRPISTEHQYYRMFQETGHVFQISD